MTGGAEGILEQVRAVWQADESDIERLEDGFYWWPGRHRVVVRCEKDTTADSGQAWRLSVRTDFARDVDISDPKIKLGLKVMASVSPTFSWIYAPADLLKKYDLPRDTNIWFQSIVYVRPETESWLPAFFARLAILQPIDAQRLGGSSFFEMLGGKPDLTGPRALEPNSTCDDILNMGQDLFAQIGQEPCRWLGDSEFEKIVERFGRSDRCFGTGDSSGLTLETPFGPNSALIRLRTDVKHPALGTGLLVSTQLPVFDTLDATMETCEWLNYFAASSWTDVPVLASWQPKEVQEGRFSPAIGTMIPNALYAPGLATNMALWSLGLARWAREAFWSDLEDSTMAEVLKARFGGSTS